MDLVPFYGNLKALYARAVAVATYLLDEFVPWLKWKVYDVAWVLLLLALARACRRRKCHMGAYLADFLSEI